MATAKRSKTHSTYKHRCNFTVNALDGEDAESVRMQRFVSFLNSKRMLNTDSAWIIEAAYQRFVREEEMSGAFAPVAEQLGVTRAPQQTIPAAAGRPMPQQPVQGVEQEQHARVIQPERGGDKPQKLVYKEEQAASVQARPASAQMQPEVEQIQELPPPKPSRPLPKWGVMSN